jgi:hypothetical protein
MLYSLFCTSVKCLVVTKQRFIDRKKAKFFGSLVFFILLLSACAMPAGDGENKAYLEARRALPFNQEQAPAPDTQMSNKKGAHFVLSSDAFANVRSSIGGAQLNELGDKIPTALTETAISKTENLINQKANEMANSVGHGKTQISLRQLETKNPDFSIRTIQPLTDLTDQSTQLTFTQAQVSSGENHGERRATFNLGIGQRYLLENGQSIAGINLFTDYEAESKHSRASLGLEYRRANFSANANQYYPLSNKVVIGDYTEEPLAGYDIRLTGQVPYLPWAKIKGTQYYWDAITGDNIKGTSLGIEANINAATTFEIGTQNSNTASRSGYAQLRIQYPYNTAPTQFIIANSAFEDSNRLSLTDLNYVERSNKIRIEKLLNGVDVVLPVYHALTTGATCTLFNASNVAIADGSGVTGPDGAITLSNVVIPPGLVYSVCTGGYYYDEATGEKTDAPITRAAMIYSGTGDVVLLASPLSEIAYQLAGTNLASTITAKNAEVAAAFGLGSNDIISTIPNDINTTKAANDAAGKFGTVLAAISQMGENSKDDNPIVTITALVNDMRDSGTIEGRDSFDIVKAIKMFANSTGDNNKRNGPGAANIDLSTGEGSVIGDLSIAFIDAYGGTGTTVPTVEQYADAGVTGVTANNLAAVNAAAVNAAVANQPAGTTALIQALADTVITAANDAPTISGTPAATVAEDTLYSFTPTATDVDGDTLTFSITNKPDWLTFSPTTGALTGTPNNSHVGTTTGIVISVTDGTASIALAAFAIEVTNVNDAPTISGTPAATVAEDTLYSFTPAATDVDGDTLTFSITNKPDWATFSTSTGALTGTPDNSDAGTTTGIVISVTDGVASPISLASFAIAVTKLAEIHLGTQIWSASKPMVASTIVETTPTCGVGRSQAVMPP